MQDLIQNFYSKNKDILATIAFFFTASTFIFSVYLAQVRPLLLLIALFSTMALVVLMSAVVVWRGYRSVRPGRPEPTHIIEYQKIHISLFVGFLALAIVFLILYLTFTLFLK